MSTTNRSTSAAPIKFAYWVPNVSGGLVISKIPQRTSWDLDYNVKLAQIAENSGFDYALSQIRFTAGYGAEFQHEPVTFSQALLGATQRLKLIAALLPGPWHPAVAAKQIATISLLYGDRIAVNVVSGWFRGEFAAIGEHWLDHDERYRRSEEFIRALRGAWTDESFTLRVTSTDSTISASSRSQRSRQKSSRAAHRERRAIWRHVSRIGTSPTAIRQMKSTSRYPTSVARRPSTAARSRSA